MDPAASAQAARDRAFRAAEAISRHTVWDTAREILRLWLHRETLLAEIRSAALSGEPLELIHHGCELCAEAEQWLILRNALDSWDRSHPV